MSEEQVVAQEGGVIEVPAKKDDREEVIPYDFGANLGEMVDKFGEEVVFSNARASMKITLQGIMRRYMAAGKSSAEIAALSTEWKPGVQLERVIDPAAVAKRAMAGMTEEQRQAFIENLLAG